jgi:hypothetical protein
LRSRAETAARILPGNELNGPAIDLLKTLKNLIPPSLLGGSIDVLIQTADEGIDEGASNLRRKCERTF